MPPLVSVIIPAYNYGTFLKEAVESVQGQSLPDWECLVVDDGSVDDTRQIVAEMAARDGRVRYFHQQNKGLSATRNRGIAESRGNFLQFLDADDLIEERKLELHVAYLQSHPDVDIVYAEARYFHNDRPWERLFSKREDNRSWMSKASGKGREILGELIPKNLMVVSSPLIRRHAVQRCGGFNEELTAHEDWEYWIRCALGGCHFQYLELPQTWTLIRYHAACMSQNPSLMLRTNREIHLQLGRFLSDADLQQANEREIAKVDLLLAQGEMKNGAKLAGFWRLLQLSIRHRKLVVEWCLDRLSPSCRHAD